MSGGNIHPSEFGSIFLSGDFERIYRCSSYNFQQLISLEQFSEMAFGFNRGVQAYQIEHYTILQHLHRYLWLDELKERAIAVTFDGDQRIQSLYIKSFVTFPETDRVFTKNIYRLPVNGEWFVFWGGANEFINYHYAYENLRYAYDLLKEQNGSSFHGTQLENENFYAFDEEIVAPADGQVVKVIDGIKDNVPGEMDPDNLAGNYVVIMHAEKEYSMLAHLKKDSITVKNGDTVKSGQVIGKCGNSGNSSEPHLHFQVMDCPDFEKGHSLRIRFEGGTEPIQGDTVDSAKSKDAREEKLDKIDTAMTIGEIGVYISRAFTRYFQ